MNGIKSHTHQEHAIIIQKLIPLIRRKFKNDLLAIATVGSFALKADINYSDVELIVFTKENSRLKEWVFHEIIDGMLIVVITETKNGYIQKYLDIPEIWYASGDSPLAPIINEKYINEINTFKPRTMEKRCWDQAAKRWYMYQEITAKVFNNIKKRNTTGLPIIFFSMIKELLIILSFINQTPYKTLEKYVEQAQMFSIKPDKFDNLLDILNKGTYQDFTSLEESVTQVFTDLETIFQKHGYPLYKNSIDLV